MNSIRIQIKKKRNIRMTLKYDKPQNEKKIFTDWIRKQSFTDLSHCNTIVYFQKLN